MDRELGFPYFGDNWDSLDELLGDLDWITERRVVILHSDLPSLPPDQFTTYLSILEDSIVRWSTGDGHEFVVGFPEEERERVSRMRR